MLAGATTAAATAVIEPVRVRCCPKCGSPRLMTIAAPKGGTGAATPDTMKGDGGVPTGSGCNPSRRGWHSRCAPTTNGGEIGEAAVAGRGVSDGALA